MSPAAACPRPPPQGPLQRAPVEPRPRQLVLQNVFPPRSAGSALPGLPSTTGPGKTQLTPVLGWGCSALCHPLAIRAPLPTAPRGLSMPFPTLQPLRYVCLLTGPWLTTPIFTNGSLLGSNSSPNYPGVSVHAQELSQGLPANLMLASAGTFHRPLRSQSIPRWLLMACTASELLWLRLLKSKRGTIQHPFHTRVRETGILHCSALNRWQWRTDLSCPP